MNKSENTKYIEIANTIFNHFEGCREGQGCYLMRNLRSLYRKPDQIEFLRTSISIVLFNLCENGYLVPDEDSLDGFMRLTSKGEDYLKGGSLIVNKIDISHYVVLIDEPKAQFEQMWEIIGDNATAPFYIKGPIFLNMIKPYLSTHIPDYMQYMEDLRKKEESTSRRDWYKKLYLQLPKDKQSDFLEDLSRAVNIIYYYKDKDLDELSEYVQEKLDVADDIINSVVPDLPELNVDKFPTRKAPEDLYGIAMEICNSYKSLIENNRMYKLLYNDDGTPKDETVSQLLFYSIAQGYCKKYDVDINRESDPGIGELDFKFSVGNRSKVVMEMKLSSNSTLYHGYAKQLPAYLRAEEINKGILIVIQLTTNKPNQLVKIEEEYAKNKNKANNEVDVLVIDATPKPSASKL